ncbi:isochorismatase family protein [candidate division KSB3 bacterium]|uniref:Isochorismatase family protein n=1 Tax=candidate division KSB3 bacterium TaxID=2044937 RepID=A0A9D5Q7E1_9BACT|nr:isochorismatase family protein [candidate division KSB3 bacterium]MBD3326804.1 isochorismatase family protein [candidate division KSB3 bacterium]
MNVQKTTPRLELLITDPQNSFCHPEDGELYVPGAEKDMERLAALIERLSEQLAQIHVTLDTHHELDVGHPLFWVNKQGDHPEPFTVISKEEVQNGTWQPYDPDLPSPPYATLLDRMITYVNKLDEHGRYQLTIWPPHCRLGTPGHNVAASLREALRIWEHTHYAVVDYVIKGINIFTEHYSGMQADVPDPEDLSTQLNTGLLRSLEEADVILLSGEALSHCVANTVRDLAKNFSAETLRKCVLLKDAMSPVPGFEQFGEDFLQEMTAKGMRIETTTSFSL